MSGYDGISWDSLNVLFLYGDSETFTEETFPKFFQALDRDREVVFKSGIKNENGNRISSYGDYLKYSLGEERYFQLLEYHEKNLARVFVYGMLKDYEQGKDMQGSIKKLYDVYGNILGLLRGSRYMSMDLAKSRMLYNRKISFTVREVGYGSHFDSRVSGTDCIEKGLTVLMDAFWRRFNG